MAAMNGRARDFDNPLPAPLVRRVVKARIAQVEAGKGYGRARS
jgi:hypothetical protein